MAHAVSSEIGNASVDAAALLAEVEALRQRLAALEACLPENARAEPPERRQATRQLRPRSKIDAAALEPDAATRLARRRALGLGVLASLLAFIGRNTARAADALTIGPAGVTVEADATFKKGLTVDGAGTFKKVTVGGYSADDKDELGQVIWLRNLDNGWDEQLIKYKSKGRSPFGHAGFGIHMHKTREFGIWTSDLTPLFSVEGATGSAWIKGTLTVGKAGINQEGWQAAKLFVAPRTGISWSGYLDYFKDSLGIVHLRGLVESVDKIALFDSRIFEFSDVAYRPAKDEVHVVGIVRDRYRSSKPDFGRLRIDTNGVVEILFPQFELNCVIYLDGVTFRAAG